MNNPTEKSSIECEDASNDVACSESTHRNRFNSGFTLIEVLIVIAIIGSLSAIAVPNYLKYKNEAKVMVAITDIRLIEQQIAIFVLDNNGQLPNNLNDLPNNSTVNDPWGNPYRYLDTQGGKAIGKRKNMSDNPVNLDYDLYSIGKDGVSKPSFKTPESRDDVVRAYEGRYVGLVSEL